MDKDIKRRAFLVGIVGILIGAPFVARFLIGRKPLGEEFHRFSADLKKYREMVATPIQEVSGESPFTLGLTPPIGEEWKYLIFAPSFLPGDLSHATDGEPDTFIAREGKIFLNRTEKGQTVITGGDTLFTICSPTNTEERPEEKIVLLFNQGNLRPAKPKGGQVTLEQDIQFQHLLGLESVPPQNRWNIGTQWKGKVGRVKPFKNYDTDYEIAGFSEIDHRKTVKIRFSGFIPDLENMPEVVAQKPEKGIAVTNTHRGNAWFDLETGFLVRQEVDMMTRMSGIKGYRTPDGSDTLTVSSNIFIQIFNT